MNNYFNFYHLHSDIKNIPLHSEFKDLDCNLVNKLDIAPFNSYEPESIILESFEKRDSSFIQNPKGSKPLKVNSLSQNNTNLFPSSNSIISKSLRRSYHTSVPIKFDNLILHNLEIDNEILQNVDDKLKVLIAHYIRIEGDGGVLVNKYRRQLVELLKRHQFNKDAINKLLTYEDLGDYKHDGNTINDWIVLYESYTVEIDKKITQTHLKMLRRVYKILTIIHYVTNDDKIWQQWDDMWKGIGSSIYK